MRSSIEFWERAPFDPRRELGSEFRVIAMDQRNAGRSRAPITSDDGWDDYARDHLALLDHLGIERCHLMGGCIGSSFCLGVIQAAPERVSAAVLQNPIGLDENRGVFFEMFDGWAAAMKKRDPDLDEQSLAAFRHRMYGEDFTFNVTRDFVGGVTTPLLILAGDDQYHPTVGREGDRGAGAECRAGDGVEGAGGGAADGGAGSGVPSPAHAGEARPPSDRDTSACEAAARMTPEHEPAQGRENKSSSEQLLVEGGDRLALHRSSPARGSR